MLLVLDVGNTNLVIGIYDEQDLLFHWRLQTVREATSDEYALQIYQLLYIAKLNVSEIKGIIISSVVFSLVETLKKMSCEYFNLDPIFVSSNLNTDLKFAVDAPEELGADRITNAVAARVLCATASCIVIDFGTATTVDYISEKGIFEGGVILPGIKTSLESLYQKAPRLPNIEIRTPFNVVGKNTKEAMCSGIIFGYAAQIDGIIERIKKEKKEEKISIIATGGLASLMVEATHTTLVVEPFLTLKGLQLLHALQ